MSFTFGSTAPANKTTPSGGFSLNPATATQAPQGIAAATTTTPSLGGFTLGAGDAKSSAPLSFAPLSTTTASAQKPLGFSMPIVSSAAPAPNVGFSLPLTSVTPIAAAAATTTPAATTSLFVMPQPAVSSAIKLGAPTATTTVTSTTAVASQPLGQSTVATALVTSTSVTSAAAAGLPTSSMNYVQLEEIINKWTLELEEQEKLFINQATQINAWDRLLVNNSEKIVELNHSVENLKLQQQQLDYELDFILAQQRELEECLVPLEKELASTPVNIDPQREHMYHMAENVDTQLKQMSEDLKEIIEHLNESSKTQDNTDPIVQIGRILNAHMNSLQWIDEHILQIQNKLDEVSKLHDLHRRENERSFRLTYE